MKNIASEIHQNLSPQRKRVVVVKVVITMAILLFGVPTMMVLAASYYTNKGIIKEAYLMTHEYTQRVVDFYNNNHKCPTNHDIKVVISEEDTVSHIDFTSNLQTSSCYITSTLKPLGTAINGKLIVLTKVFSKQTTNNTDWQCFSNANYWLLPKECNNKSF